MKFPESENEFSASVFFLLENACVELARVSYNLQKRVDGQFHGKTRAHDHFTAILSTQGCCGVSTCTVYGYSPPVVHFDLGTVILLFMSVTSLIHSFIGRQAPREAQLSSLLTRVIKLFILLSNQELLSNG